MAVLELAPINPATLGVMCSRDSPIPSITARRGSEIALLDLTNEPEGQKPWAIRRATSYGAFGPLAAPPPLASPSEKTSTNDSESWSPPTSSRPRSLHDSNRFFFADSPKAGPAAHPDLPRPSSLRGLASHTFPPRSPSAPFHDDDGRRCPSPSPGAWYGFDGGRDESGSEADSNAECDGASDDDDGGHWSCRGAPRSLGALASLLPPVSPQPSPRPPSAAGDGRTTERDPFARSRPPPPTPEAGACRRGSFSGPLGEAAGGPPLTEAARRLALMEACARASAPSRGMHRVDSDGSLAARAADRSARPALPPLAHPATPPLCVTPPPTPVPTARTARRGAEGPAGGLPSPLRRVATVGAALERLQSLEALQAERERA